MTIYSPHQWVPMTDGIRLSASVWLPGESAAPAPAILEIIPYRKRDHTAARDYQIHTYFAQHGYAAVRVDMRGHGDSEGLHDPHRTYQDVEELIVWMRSDPWCSGQVEMVGLSWGGTNSFMAASRKPPGLGAIVTSASSHDRYGVGMLWKNGCLLNENFGWVTSVTAFSTRPPDPEVQGSSWRSLWRHRLENHTPEAMNMLGRQCRDEYWDKHLASSIDEATAATYMFSGWADNNYAQTPPQLLEQLKAPAAAVLGPWGHKYPHQGYPGPAINFLKEATDWFDRHLRGSTMAPVKHPLTVFVAEDLPATSMYDSAPGRWAALRGLPQAGLQLQYFLDYGRLNDAPLNDRDAVIEHLSPLNTGTASGEVMPWFANGPAPELPGDQRIDDGNSLCFDSVPLAKDVEYIGRPVFDIEFSVDRPVAMLAVRICDVKSNGESSRVSLGLFNLNQRPEAGGSEREPKNLVPGRKYRMKLVLDFGAYKFRAGHRIRLAISTSYWPMVWPSPEQVTIKIYPASSTFSIPLHDRNDELPSHSFGEPVVGESLSKTELQPPVRVRKAKHDAVNGFSEIKIGESNGPYRLDAIDWTVSSRTSETYRVTDQDPLAATAEIEWDWSYARGAWTASSHVRSSLRCDAGNFIVAISVSATENNEEFFTNEWHYVIPRNHV